VWELSPDYVTRVLQPAAERFTRGEGLPDLFTRYDLRDDVDSRPDIERALEQVRGVWNKQRNHPVFGRLVAAMMTPEELGHTQRTLFDPEARALARPVAERNRKKAEAAQFEKLDHTIQLAAAKGYITPEEKAEIERQYAAIPAAVIEKRIRVPIRGGNNKREDRREVIPSTVRPQIRRALAALSKKDLLDFLDLKRGASKAAIESAYESLQKQWRAHAADSRKTSAQELLGVLKQYFVGRDPALLEALHETDLLDGFRPDMLVVLAKKSIEASEIDALVASAVRLGVPEARARQYILDVAREAGAAIGGGASAAAIICTNCGTANPDLRARVCVTCRASLWRNCPRCREENPLVAVACGKCGFDLATWEDIALLIRQATLALDSADITTAEELAARVEQVWGREGEAGPLFERLAELRRVTKDLTARAEQAIARKRFFAARDLIAQLQRRNPKAVPGLSSRVEAEIGKIAPIITRAHTHEAKREFRDAYIAYAQAAAIVTDSSEVLDGLKRPPEPVPDVTAAFDGTAVTVRWKESPAAGDIKYSVVRGEGTAPKSPQNGTPIGATSARSIRDTAPVAGSRALYAVFVSRGDAWSEPCLAVPCLINADVESAAVRAGDGVIYVDWKPHRGTRVRVFRSAGSSTAEVEMRDVTPTGFADRSVQNGATYAYRIVVEYGTDVSAGLRISATSEKPPEPVAAIELRPEKDGLHVTWNPPSRGSVSIIRVSPPLRWKRGDNIQVSDTRPAVHLAIVRNGEAIDRQPPPGTSCYLALNVIGSVAIVGDYRFFSNLTNVTGLGAEDFGDYVQLRWDWPADCRIVRVAWTTGAPAASATAAIKEQSTDISQGEYMRAGSLRVSPGPGVWYFRAFARSDDGAFSSGTTPGANAVAKTRRGAVKYSLTRGKIFSRNRVKLTLRSGQSVFVPEIVVVAAPGDRQPQTAAEGREVLRIKATKLDAREPRDFDFDIGWARLPVFVRAFFISPTAYDEIELKDPPPSEARMR
jgi:hypothetical protein